MAGHSKYKNIMYRKGAQDKKRSALFSKLSREITVAAKMGLPDPGRQRAAARRDHRRARPVDAQGQYPALDRQGVGSATPRITRRSATKASARAGSRSSSRR